MKLERIALVPCMVLLAVAPAWGETYKNTYPVACSEIWPAVQATLADQEHYAKVKIDEAKMSGEYQPKHNVHVDISGVLLQCMNKVRLVPKGTGCEMQVVSNYSGWGHDDKSDFKKRVDDALIKEKTAAPAETAKPGPPSN